MTQHVRSARIGVSEVKRACHGGDEQVAQKVRVYFPQAFPRKGSGQICVTRVSPIHSAATLRGGRTHNRGGWKDGQSESMECPRNLHNRVVAEQPPMLRHQSGKFAEGGGERDNASGVEDRGGRDQEGRSSGGGHSAIATETTGRGMLCSLPDLQSTASDAGLKPPLICMYQKSVAAPVPRSPAFPASSPKAIPGPSDV